MNTSYFHFIVASRITDFTFHAHKIGIFSNSDWFEFDEIDIWIAGVCACMMVYIAHPESIRNDFLGNRSHFLSWISLHYRRSTCGENTSHKRICQKKNNPMKKIEIIFDHRTNHILFYKHVQLDFNSASFFFRVWSTYDFLFKFHLFVFCVDNFWINFIRYDGWVLIHMLKSAHVFNLTKRSE